MFFASSAGLAGYAGLLVRNTANAAETQTGSGVTDATVTFSSVDIGDPANDRIVVVAAHTGLDTGVTITKVTIGGADATEIIKIIATGEECGVIVAALNVTSGTTADIAIVRSGTTNVAFGPHYGISVWTIHQNGTVESADATDSAEHSSGVVSLSASASPGAFGVSVAMTVNNASNDITVTGDLPEVQNNDDDTNHEEASACGKLDVRGTVTSTFTNSDTTPQASVGAMAIWNP